MSEVEQQLHRIEVSVQEARQAVALGEALQRLHDNADFKEVILSGYFEKEAQRAVMLRADANCRTPEAQEQINDLIIAIGMLGQYFHKVFTLAENAHNALMEDEKTREELLQEQLQDNTDLVN